jgi:hypothetical protein
VWALTNTASLKTATPAVALNHITIRSEVYGQPPDAVQKDGSFPLGQSLKEHEELLAGNDDRMNQAVFQGGRLWGELNTVVKTENAGTHVGAAFFVVLPTATASSVAASIAAQGYVSVNTQNLLFPSIGVTSTGKGVMTFTLSGTNFFPSAAYVHISVAAGVGDVHVAGAGVGPEDGFSGYRAFGGAGTARWGDYSAAVPDSAGHVWIAQEFIGQTCTLAQYTADNTCGGTRTQLANWGTHISEVTP